MNTIVFYVSTNPAADRQRHQIDAHHFVYIRTEILPATIDPESALLDHDHARDDEHPLNAITL